jgi:hypothetical protein
MSPTTPTCNESSRSPWAWQIMSACVCWRFRSVGFVGRRCSRWHWKYSATCRAPEFPTFSVGLGLAIVPWAPGRDAILHPLAAG